MIETAVTAEVELFDGKKARVLNIAAEDSESDLALLRVLAIPAQVLSLRDASAPNTPIGADVFAIGSPKGLTNTITQGLLNGYRGNMLQLSASISPGSSGGSVLDRSGVVVGVSTSSIEGGQNLNFAVPSDRIRELLKREPIERQLWEGTSIGEAVGSARFGAIIKLLEIVLGEDGYKNMLANFDDQKFAEIVEKGIKIKAPLAYYFKGSELNTGMTIGSLEKIPWYDKAIDADCGAYQHFVECERAEIYSFEYLRAPTILSTEFDDPAEEESQKERERYRKRVDKMGGAAGLLKQAERGFRRSLELRPAYSPALLGLVDVLKNTDSRAALISADALVQLMPRSYAAYSSRADVYEAIQEHKKACSDYRRAVELADWNAHLRLDLGMCLKRLGEYAEARAELTEALRLGLDFMESAAREALRSLPSSPN